LGGKDTDVIARESFNSTQDNSTTEAIFIVAYMGNQYFVYIMTNKNNTVLYTSVTNDLKRRVYEHREKLTEGFTKKYNVLKLVYYEVFEEGYSAISREKQIKGGPRKKKIELINSINKEWKDLYEEI
jgi:putative endonuclease